MAPASSRERPAPPAPWRQRAPRRAVLGAAAALGVRGALGGEAPAWWRAGMPPHEMPQELQEAFTLGGRVPVAAMYVDDTNGGAGTHYSVDRPGIQRLVEQFGALRARGPGPRAHRWALLFEALAARPVEGWRAVVFGSTDASVEAILLAHGAAHVTTVEYTSAARQGGPSLKWPFGVRLSGPPPQHFAFPVLRLRVPVQGVPLHALRLRHRLIPGLCPLLALT
ncbi:unnamed protein product [Prorocentrum cordatum]|uniref:Uncharacterized protein n=2 Tax=Prorocentrum cordatum TaxID=2364126 RepID=A0ABN9QHL3_9DINO|nr:unnamed protein product [Polarella glacialis]